MIGVSFGVLRFFIVNWKAEPIALASGVDVKTLSGILGHTKASFPLDTYANVTDDIQRQAAQVMDTFMTEIFGKGLIPWQSGESPAAAIRSATTSGKGVTPRRSMESASLETSTLLRRKNVSRNWQS